MLKGFRCPEFGESAGRANTISYCVKHCSVPCTAPHLLVSILEQEKANPHKGKMISVTQITGGCKRKTFLERTVDYYVTPDKKLPTFRGSLIHEVIASIDPKIAKRYKWVVEEHLELPVKTKSGAWTLSGTLDFYEAARKTIYDLKTLQDYAVTKMVMGKEEGTWSPNIPDSYVKQLNLYRYMAHQLKKFRVDRLRLQVIGFGRLFLTGTTVKYGAKKDLQTYTIPDVPILKNAVIEDWIHTEGDLWYRILFKNENAPVRDETYKWLCYSCPFYKSEFCPNPEEEARQQTLTRAKTFDV